MSQTFNENKEELFSLVDFRSYLIPIFDGACIFCENRESEKFSEMRKLHVTNVKRN